MHLEAMTAVLSSWGHKAGSGGWVSPEGPGGKAPVEAKALLRVEPMTDELQVQH